MFTHLFVPLLHIAIPLPCFMHNKTPYHFHGGLRRLVPPTQSEIWLNTSPIFLLGYEEADLLFDPICMHDKA